MYNAPLFDVRYNACSAEHSMWSSSWTYTTASVPLMLLGLRWQGRSSVCDYQGPRLHRRYGRLHPDTCPPDTSRRVGAFARLLFSSQPRPQFGLDDKGDPLVADVPRVPSRDTYRLFQNFAQRLYTGTFDRETGLDSSGLCWPPRSPQDASHIVTHLTDFFDWLGEIRPEATRVNPRYAGGAFDRQTDEVAYQHRRNKAFLGHTWVANASPAETGHRVRGRRLPKVERANRRPSRRSVSRTSWSRDSARRGATTIAACSSHCCCTARASANQSLSTCTSAMFSWTRPIRVRPKCLSTILATARHPRIGATNGDDLVTAAVRNTSYTSSACRLAPI